MTPSTQEATGLTEFAQRVQAATCPEQLFGPARDGPDQTRKRVNTLFKKYSRICHPDKFVGKPDEKLAEKTFQRLTELDRQARYKLDHGTYGDASAPTEDPPSEPVLADITVTTRHGTYVLEGQPFVEGDLALLYHGRTERGDHAGRDVVAKVARDEADNDLLRNEARLLRELWTTDPAEKPPAQLKHLPELLDEFKTVEGEHAVVLSRLDAVDLTVVRQKYPEGLVLRHTLWVMERTLSLLGYAHRRGIVHCNVEPTHVLVRPRDHNAFLVDWCYGVLHPRTGDGFKAVNETYSAPEVREKRPPLPASDIYALARSMIYLLGGDPATDRLPPSVDTRLQPFFQWLLLPSALQRPEDAWHVLHRLREIRNDIMPHTKFETFDV